jgi:phytoene synthase
MTSELSEMDAAYRHCRQITRSQAGNFYYGIRLLPASKLDAMCAVYAFARRVDDVGDGSMAPEQKLAALDRIETALVRIGVGGSGGDGNGSESAPDPVMLALADASARFALPQDALSELIEGVRMDIAGVGYERFDELVLYCRRVAGGVGRLCLAIFGSTDSRADSWAPVAADELGVAMQLTNILRDVREDAGRERVYLPREDLVRFGLIGAETTSDVDAGGQAPALLDLKASPEFEALMEFEVQRAQEWFGRGMSLLEQLDWRSAACVLAMVGIYRRLLARIAACPGAILEQRVSLPVREKLWVATQSLLGVGA